MIGQQVDGKYELVELIGEGGMGAVYRARALDSGRPLAIKLIVNEAVAKDEVLVARFQREAEAAAKVVTPHIVEIVDFGRDRETGSPFMVMELLDGESVRAVLQRIGPFSPDLAARIGAQVCQGLEHAHQAGVVHRDIKPANLFLASAEGEERIVKLLDFGVAKFKMDHAMEDGNRSLTHTGNVLGSPMYMSPEQARGLKTIDHRADIWSLGILLYQLLSGHTPHHEVKGLGELIITICSEEPEPLAERASSVPPGLADIVHRALRLPPQDRYQTAAEMGEALMAFLGGEATLREGMFAPAAESAPEPPPEAESAPEPPPEVEDAPPESVDDRAATVALDDVAALAPKLADLPALPTGLADAPVDEGGATVALDELQLQQAAQPAQPFQQAQPAQPDWKKDTMPLDDGAEAKPPAALAKPKPTAPSAWAAESGAKASLEDTASGARSPQADKKGGGGLRIVLMLSVVVVLAAAGFGVYYVHRSRAAAPETEPAPTATASAPSSASAAEPEPEPSTAASAASASSSDEQAVQTVRLKVVPPTAVVTVDGSPQEVQDGGVELKGALGSVHEVQLTADGKTTTFDVSITDQGAIPPEVVAAAGDAGP